MSDNETKNTLVDNSGSAARDLVEPDSAFADLPSIEIVFDSADGNLAATEDDGPAQDTSNIYLIDHIDLADVIADFEAPELADLTTLLHQPVGELELYPAPDEQEGDSSAEAVISNSETDPVATPGDTPGAAVGGLFSGTVTIIVDDGEGGYGSTV